MPRIVNLTNIPAPYRERMHELLFEHFKSDYTVIYCSKLEPNRSWKFEYGAYNKIFLTEKSSGYIHNNFSVWRNLNKLKPRAVISTGFNPTMIYAFIWCLINGAKHICFTDGTFNSEKSLTFIHRLARKIVFSKSDAFIGPSKGSKQLYESYNIPEKQIFTSCLAVDNSRFCDSGYQNRQFDLMFSGQLIERKMPLFFAEVARLVKEKNGKCRVLVLGNGPLKDKLIEKLEKCDVDYEYPGFISQELLPTYYAKSKFFLFPTKNDPWGIVANEAMASGTPVITCDNAGVANDLVINNENGYILPLDITTWADHVIKLLQNNHLYQQFSDKAIKHVQNYNHQAAAQGIIKAIESINTL